MNISQALSLAKKKLKESNIVSFSLDANLLLSHILDQPKEFIIFNPDVELSAKEIAKSGAVGRAACVVGSISLDINVE